MEQTNLFEKMWEAGYSECIQCGQCEAACPQHLPIISLLEKCRELES